MPLPGDGFEAQLRSAGADMVDQLELPYRFTTRELRDAISAARGKPIVTRPLHTLGVIEAPCGVRVETADADLLYYEEGTSVHHQRHILTHELMHVWRDHPGSLEVDHATAHTLGVNPNLVLRMTGRTNYCTADEIEAETLATIIRQRMYRQRELPSQNPEGGAARWDALFTQPAKRGRFRR